MRIFGSCLMIAETAENPGDLTDVILSVAKNLLQLLRIDEKSPTGEGNCLMREITKQNKHF